MTILGRSMAKIWQKCGKAEIKRKPLFLFVVFIKIQRKLFGRFRAERF